PGRRNRQGKAAAPTPKESLAAAQIGTAHHVFLQLVSFDHLSSIAGLRSEAQRLQRESILTPAEIAALDLESIAAFWESSLGHQLLACRDLLHRELPFTAKLSLGEARAFEAEEIAELKLQ